MRTCVGVVFVTVVLAAACTTSPTFRPATDKVADSTIAAAVEATVVAMPLSPTIFATQAVPRVPSPIPIVIAPSSETNLEAFVTRVIDGDTVDVAFLEGSVEAARRLGLGLTETVRLLGVDTPETFSSNNPGEYGNITDTACLDTWGDLATQFAVEALDQQTVVIALDSGAGLRGSFGRLLAYVQVDGVDFNARLVQSGYARVYEEGSSKREADYMSLQGDAQAQSIGLWECASVPILSTPTITPDASRQPDNNCDAAYPNVCIPPPPPDLDCGQVRYTNFTVLAPDPHKFDGDKDGIGCER